MPQVEELVKIMLPNFLAYLDMLESGEIAEKELDIKENPSIHCVANTSKGDENADSFRNC